MVSRSRRLGEWECILPSLYPFHTNANLPLYDPLVSIAALASLVCSGTDNIGVVDKAKYSNWHGGNMDPDAVKRHQRGLKR